MMIMIVAALLTPSAMTAKGLLPAEAAIAEQADDECGDRGERRRLGHRDDAAIDSRRRRRTGTAEGGPARPAVDRARSRSMIWAASRREVVLARVIDDPGGKQHRLQQAGQDAGEEEGAAPIARRRCRRGSGAGLGGMTMPIVPEAPMTP